MKVESKISISGSKKDIWSVITDIEHSDQNISGINSIEIINKPEDSLIGLKWKEARTMFGKEAFETMWITHAEENTYYQTRAESHGAVYISKFTIKEKDDTCELTMGFEGTPQSMLGKIMNAIFSGMMKKSTLKTIDLDLQDIKKVVESK
ncbi:SRPBCC family protein [Acidaminobacter sp. JC074]|uniref:SRPBCC family protein n=1 Tax=Acidaminobacter sp. JC074 TaxID=2530199 RepID=UPI001F0D0D0E|nr:SRPBCC family protein [Acidaminobacter sp. JC074]MCH4887877.1 SRPBCC family protein [Acidaminobacter sp. JC074]